MSGEFAAAEAFFFPLRPTCHKVIPCRGCKSLNMINSHANKYNCVSSWMEDRLWKSLRLRHVVLWQIFFKCFLLFKLEILLINQLRQQMLSSWGAAPGFRSQMVDFRTSTRELQMCPGFCCSFPSPFRYWGTLLYSYQIWMWFVQWLFLSITELGGSFPQSVGSAAWELLCSASPSYQFLQLEFPRVP